MWPPGLLRKFASSWFFICSMLRHRFAGISSELAEYCFLTFKFDSYTQNIMFFNLPLLILTFVLEKLAQTTLVLRGRSIIVYYLALRNLNRCQ